MQKRIVQCPKCQVFQSDNGLPCKECGNKDFKKTSPPPTITAASRITDSPIERHLRNIAEGRSKALELTNPIKSWWEEAFIQGNYYALANKSKLESLLLKPLEGK